MKYVGRTLLLLLSGMLWLACGPRGAESTEAGTSAGDRPADLSALQASVVQSDRFWSEPAVIQACDGGPGKTVVHWNVPGLNRVEVHVESATGPLFSLAGPVNSKETGPWVKDKMRFYLVNAENHEVLETQMVRVTKLGCPN